MRGSQVSEGCCSRVSMGGGGVSGLGLQQGFQGSSAWVSAWGRGGCRLYYGFNRTNLYEVARGYKSMASRGHFGFLYM